MSNDAYKLLRLWAEKYKTCFVAFSGGVDSSLLLYVLHKYTKLKLTAITIALPYTPPWEIKEAEEFCKNENIKQRIIKLKTMAEIKNNPINRCYLCKHNMFSVIKKAAEKENIDIVIDGTNFDDVFEERPGMQALTELGIESPLRLAKFGKQKIRHASRQLNLATSEKSSCSCLLTRLPYDHIISMKDLSKIATSEQYLHSVLTDNVRVRINKNSTSIEIGSEKLKDITPAIKNKLGSFGFTKITYKKRDGIYG